MTKIVCFLAVGFVSLSTLAAPIVGQVKDLARVQKLVPKGRVLARTYQVKNNEEQADVQKYTEEEKKEILASSYIVYDLNKDGHSDVLLITEKLICYDPVVNNKCTSDYHGWGGEDRLLEIYLSNKQGKLPNKASAFSRSIMINDGEGGSAARDPLEVFEIDENGHLNISYWGGSAMKWSIGLTIQYRQAKNGKYGFYLIQSREMMMEWYHPDNNPENEVKGILIITTEKNFVTGEQKVTEGYELSDDSATKDDVVKYEKFKKTVLKRFGTLKGNSSVFGW